MDGNITLNQQTYAGGKEPERSLLKCIFNALDTLNAKHLLHMKAILSRRERGTRNVDAISVQCVADSVFTKQTVLLCWRHLDRWEDIFADQSTIARIVDLYSYKVVVCIMKAVDFFLHTNCCLSNKWKAQQLPLRTDWWPYQQKKEVK